MAQSHTELLTGKKLEIKLLCEWLHGYYVNDCPAPLTPVLLQIWPPQLHLADKPLQACDRDLMAH